MKLFLLTSFLFLNNHAFSQELSYKNLKEQIGNHIFEFEKFFNIKSDSINDNFGDLTLFYKNVNKNNSAFDLVIKTKNKNIENIVVKNKKDRTSFFKTFGIDLENSVVQKKNYKTIYLSTIKNSNKKKTYFDNINDLINNLKIINLNENIGYIESDQLKTSLTINDLETILIIN